MSQDNNLELPQVKPATFFQIRYQQQIETNYLSDFIGQHPTHASFVESLNFNEQAEKKQHGSFDTIADDLYKKILKQGYIERPSKVIRKKGKGDSDVNFYNLNDNFINDDECCIEKKDKFSQYSDYSCLGISIQDLYNSEFYKEKVEDLIVEINKRKTPDQFNLKEDHDLQKYDEVKKKIRKSIKEMITNKTIPNPENKSENAVINAVDIVDQQQQQPLE